MTLMDRIVRWIRRGEEDAYAAMLACALDRYAAVQPDRDGEDGCVAGLIVERSDSRQVQ